MINIAAKEEEILKFWQDNKIFEKTLTKDSPQGEFVFFEGPPTANGKPGIHHVLARAFKDIIPRFKSMQGYRVNRKAGWDTHGLPVELEVEKKLELHDKKAVEEYGIENFNQQCQTSVWQYKEDWEKMTARMGFWLDMDHPYITYDNDYIESLWHIVKQIDDKGLLYKGHKVIPQCPRCGTALSSHEVAQGYKNVKEVSVYLKFKIKDTANEYILAWTTTPWTLPGNVALAVGPQIKYVKIKSQGDVLILAKNLLSKIDGEYQLIEELTGEKLIGLEYEPLFENVVQPDIVHASNAFKVYPADFVSIEDGTGVVHTAVMYGVEDYELGEQIGLPKVHTVNLDGTFNELVPAWQGKFVKDVEPEIIEHLKKAGKLYKTEKYAHDYPFCWRCDSPLIYYAKDSWYFKMSQLREELIKNNQTVNWVPTHIKDGRFGEWLREVKDWAISRERYWGTPLPIWICEQCGARKIIGSRGELGVDETFDLHRPYIDDIKLKCECGGQMIRTPEVMDCWFDSGSMPFAQLHYPFENKELIDDGLAYPADFISEAIDQTRGWFYTLLAVATLLGKQSPYKNVICLGHILDKNGQKMSKSKGNIIDPWQMFDRYGADAVRWYLYTINQPGEPKRFDEKGLKESARIFTTLLNVVNFYKMFSSGSEESMTEPIHVLDRWIVSLLEKTKKRVTSSLEAYDVFTSSRSLESFINDLSLWYVRRSRDRFKGQDEQDKQRALNTLRGVILNINRLLAPFAPFVSESINQKMNSQYESVHLSDWPEVNESQIEQKVIDYMEITRKVVEIGLAARAEKGIKIRQPLAKLEVKNIKLDDDYLGLIADELNVKQVVCIPGTGELQVELDINITPELKQEGLLRELIRSINNLRKQVGLTIGDQIQIKYQTDDQDIKQVFEKFENELKQQTIASKILTAINLSDKVKINDLEIGLQIEKI